MNQRLRIGLIGLTTAVLFGCSFLAAPSGVQTPSAPTSPASSAVTEPAPVVADGAAAALEHNLEATYQQVSPSVVQIEVIQKPGSGSSSSGSNGSSLVSGSGFVYDSSGDIVTNNHVITDAQTILVFFPDGTQVEANLVGADPGSDLAVIHVTADPSLIQPVTLGDSSTVKVGQLVVVIGYPFGLDSTMTYGIVSGVSRLLPVSSADGSGLSYSIPDVIQTDAPINPGNSGGVLVDDLGEVIGVPSAGISASGDSAGVGFAIPSNIVKMEVPTLIGSGSYPHAYLGISGATLSPEVASAMGLDPKTRGVLIDRVQTGGPASNAGLLGSTKNATIFGIPAAVGGDVIVAADGQTIASFDDLIRYMFMNKKIGDTMQLTVLRGTQTITVEVHFTPLPGS
jgi:S1-C subfamily serine protease